MTRPEEETEAPEGGWGYVICIALIVNFFCCFSHVNSFAMLYNDFFLGLGEGTGAITLVTGVTSIVISFSGILTNVALKKFSLRQVGLLGAALYTVGWFLNFFTTALYQMVITSGVLSAMGTIIITTVTFANFNNYFVEKRVTILSICQMVVGLGTMFCPLLIELMLDQYGYRGTILVLSAVMGNTILATLCLHPVEWHTKRNRSFSEISADELNTNTVKNTTILRISNTKVDGDLKNQPTQCANIPKSSLSPHKHEMEEEKEMGKWKAMVKCMDLSLLQDVVYLNITIGIAFTLFSDYGFFLMYPLFLYSMDYTNAEVAYCLTVVSAADLLSRGLLALVSMFHHFPSRDIFFMSTVGAAVSKIIFLQCNPYWSFVATSFVMGLFRGPLALTVPLVYAESAQDRFAAAYGLAGLFRGVTDTLMFPALGYIRDYFDSFLVAFYIYILLHLICIIPWTYEYWCTRRNKSYRNKR